MIVVKLMFLNSCTMEKVLSRRQSRVDQIRDIVLMEQFIGFMLLILNNFAGSLFYVYVFSD